MASIQLNKGKQEQQEAFDEKKQVEEWRRFIFRDIMETTGATEIMADDIEALVRSNANWEQVRTLRENGCPPELVIKILT